MKPLAIVVSLTTLVLAQSAATSFGPLPERQAHAAGAKLPAESIVGEWVTENEDGRVRFVKHGDGTYRGIVTWGARPRRDRFNKNPKLRQRPIVGIVLMWHLVYRDGAYEDGYVYNPEDGATYRVKAWIVGPDSLELRGYMGISLLGQTQTWKRYR